MKNSVYILSVLLFLACNNTPKDNALVTVSKDTTENVTMATSAPELDGCYFSNQNKDSSNLKINIKNGEVTGTLNYNLYEKDKNSGTISGSYKDSLIIANYSFQSEGVTSMREVVFKVANGELLEGYGDIETAGSIVKFKDISQLKYQDKSPFIKKECK
ncbi:MAG: hypothetical protein ABI204_04875 [Ginsengibacter sp.]